MLNSIIWGDGMIRGLVGGWGGGELMLWYWTNFVCITTTWTSFWDCLSGKSIPGFQHTKHQSLNSVRLH